MSNVKSTASQTSLPKDVVLAVSAFGRAVNGLIKAEASVYEAFKTLVDRIRANDTIVEALLASKPSKAQKTIVDALVDNLTKVGLSEESARTRLGQMRRCLSAPSATWRKVSGAKLSSINALMDALPRRKASGRKSSGERSASLEELAAQFVQKARKQGYANAQIRTMLERALERIPLAA